jgi:hypothetical protein
MAWKITDSVVRGEIDNRLPGIIKGSLYLDGLKAPVTLELEGDCDPDLAGRHLTFRNLMPAVRKEFEGFSELQCGEAGTMTANRMVRIPTISDDELHRCIQERKPIPTRWSESLYLEWFSDNGRVLIEGSSFACQLSPAKWTVTDEAHEWSEHLKTHFDCPFWSDNDEDADIEEMDESTAAPRGKQHPFAFNLTAVNGQPLHPLVKRLSEFLLQMIGESKSRKFYVDKAAENEPLEEMFEATSRATVRLAHAMAKAAGPEVRLESKEIVRGLRQARWSLGEACELADLAKHMCSADSEWLGGLRREFGQLRKEIRGLILEHEELSRESSPASARASAPTDSVQGEPNHE